MESNYFKCTEYNTYPHYGTPLFLLLVQVKTYIILIKNSDLQCERIVKTIVKKHQKLELATKSVKVVNRAGQIKRAGKISYEK